MPDTLTKLRACGGGGAPDGPDRVDLKLSPAGLEQAKIGMTEVVNDEVIGTGKDAALDQTQPRVCGDCRRRPKREPHRRLGWRCR